jgi:hypothetical protein
VGRITGGFRSHCPVLCVKAHCAKAKSPSCSRLKTKVIPGVVLQEGNTVVMAHAKAISTETRQDCNYTEATALGCAVFM